MRARFCNVRRRVTTLRLLRWRLRFWWARLAADLVLAIEMLFGCLGFERTKAPRNRFGDLMRADYSGRSLCLCSVPVWLYLSGGNQSPAPCSFAPTEPELGLF